MHQNEEGKVLLTKREYLVRLLQKLAIRQPRDPIVTPEKLEGFITILIKSARCTLCNKCVEICPEDALSPLKIFDLASILKSPYPEDLRAKNRLTLYELLRKLARGTPKDQINVPEGLEGFGDIEFRPEKCTACDKCKEVCPEDAIEVLPQFDLPRALENLAKRPKEARS